MTPWQLAKKSEFSHQSALFAWANNAALFGYDIANDPDGYALDTRNAKYVLSQHRPVPELNRLFAIHNQGHGDAIRGGKAKAEGVKPGVPDIMLPVTTAKYAGLFIEMKLPGYASSDVKDKQLDWRDFLLRQHYKSIICGGWEHAALCIRDYLEHGEIYNG